MSYAPTTQLEAVNTMLSTIGEAPAASLTNPPIDASMALNLLNEVTKDFQTEGWYFNTDWNVVLALAPDGSIPLPANTALVEIDRKLSPNVRAVLQWSSANNQPQLYDTLHQTIYFSQAVTARRIIKWLDWTQLPETARRYITIRAARIFGDRMVGAESVHQFSAQDEAMARQKFQADDGRATEMNMLHSPDTARILLRNNWGYY